MLTPENLPLLITIGVCAICLVGLFIIMIPRTEHVDQRVQELQRMCHPGRQNRPGTHHRGSMPRSPSRSAGQFGRSHPALVQTLLAPELNVVRVDNLTWRAGTMHQPRVMITLF